MSGDVLMSLAQFAGQAVATAALTDVWEAVRGKVAKLLGRARKPEVADRWLSQTRDQLMTTPDTERERALLEATGRWRDRFADLLDEYPGLEPELRALAEEITAQLPAGAVSATDHSVAAGRDLTIAAKDGSVAAGAIHGNVAPPHPPDPTPPGPATP